MQQKGEELKGVSGSPHSVAGLPANALLISASEKIPPHPEFIYSGLSADLVSVLLSSV